MKEVYVLYGRKRFHEGVFDHDGHYFDEAPIVEVFDNFDDAKSKLKEYAIEAYNYVKLCGAGYIVDDNFIEETTAADLFAGYYMTPPKIYKSFTGKTSHQPQFYELGRGSQKLGRTNLQKRRTQTIRAGKGIRSSSQTNRRT